MENRRNNPLYSRHSHSWHCRRLLQQWKICLVLLAGCSGKLDHLTSEDYSVCRVHRAFGDTRLGLSLEALRIENKTKIFLLPRAGTFLNSEITIDGQPFTCHLLLGGERMLLTEQAISYLFSRTDPLIKTDTHNAQIENFPLALLDRSPLPNLQIILDLER